MKVKLTWKRRTNDGWGCPNLYAGSIKIGSVSRELWNNPKGMFAFNPALPSIDIVYAQDIESAKQLGEELARFWFNEVAK